MNTIDEIPAKHARLSPDRECLTCEDHRLTWRQLDERVNRLANGLRSLGLERGEHVAVLAHNSHRFVELYYAAARAGLVVVPLNWRLPAEDLAFILEHADAVALVSDGVMHDTARGVREQLPRIRCAIAFDAPEPGMVDYEELLRSSSDRMHVAPHDEDDMCVLMYTGGTTGRPKGVMISHRNLLTATLGCVLAGGVQSSDSTLMVLPLFHIALWPVLALHFVGGRVAVNARIDLGVILETIERERVTHINVVPTVLAFLLAYPDVGRYDLSSLRLLTYAGAPMPLALLLQVKERFPKLDLAQGYGLTETASIVSMLDAEAHRHARTEIELERLRSAGREALTTSVRIVDDTGADVPRGTLGEVCARGANVMLGYWKDPGLTAAAMHEGWLRTGDVGFVDGEGLLHIVDRKHDMIITGGENVYPRQVEDVLYEHPAVMECAVIGLPDPVWGEAITAVLMLKPGASATVEEIVEHCAARLAGYMKPKRVEFVDDLPKTSIGKIARRQVREAFAHRAAAARGNP